MPAARGSVRYHCTHEDYAVSDPARFAQARMHDAHARPDAVFEDVDEALDWLYETIAADLNRTSDPEAAAERAGLSDDEGWASRRDISRVGLLVERRTVGRGTRIGGDRIAHAHVYPVEVP